MSYLERTQMLQRLHALIQRKGTGTAMECASRLDISRATFFRSLDRLKAVGAEVYYCRESRSYVYENDFSF